MAFQFFAIPIRNPQPAQEEMNSFLLSHKVLTIDRRWVDQGADSFWSFCIDYQGAGESKSGPAASRGKKPQVDYREVLNDEEFALYSELREIRKEVATKHGVAIYLVFTNEQLAAMVQQKATTTADLEKIVGAGSVRLTKYAEPFLEFLSKQWSSPHEASRKPR